MSFTAVPSKPKILSKFTSPTRDISAHGSMKENIMGAGFMSPQIYLQKTAENTAPYGANPFQSPQARLRNAENMLQMGINNYPALGQPQGKLIVMASPSSTKFTAGPVQGYTQFASPKTGRGENMYHPQLIPMGIQVPQQQRVREPLQDNTNYFQTQRNIQDYSSPLRAKGNVFPQNYPQVEAKITLKPGLYASPGCNRTIDPSAGQSFIRNIQPASINTYNSNLIANQRESFQYSAREAGSRLQSFISTNPESNRETFEMRAENKNHRASIESARAAAQAPVIKVNGEPIQLESSINILVNHGEPAEQNYQGQFQMGTQYQQNSQAPQALQQRAQQTTPASAATAPQKIASTPQGLSSLLQNVTISNTSEQALQRQADAKEEKATPRTNFLQVPGVQLQNVTSQYLPSGDVSSEQLRLSEEEETPMPEGNAGKAKLSELAEKFEKEKVRSGKLEESRKKTAENIVNAPGGSKKNEIKSKYDDIVKKCVERTQNALKLVNGQSSFSNQNISLFNETMESIHRDSASFFMDAPQQETQNFTKQVKVEEKFSSPAGPDVTRPQATVKAFTSSNKTKIEEMFNNAMNRSRAILGKYPSLALGTLVSPPRSSISKREAPYVYKIDGLPRESLGSYKQNDSLDASSMPSNRQTGFLGDSSRTAKSIKPVLTLYKGDLIETVKNGRGVGTYHNGEQYEGSWVDNCRSGYGTLRDGQGKLIYSGDWLSDEFHGQGVFRNTRCENGSINYRDFGEDYDRFCEQYEGEFRDGLRSGFGTLVFTSGDKFLGKFLKSAIHGEGTFYSKNGDTIIGFWDHNKLTRVI